MTGGPRPALAATLAAAFFWGTDPIQGQSYLLEAPPGAGNGAEVRDDYREPDPFSLPILWKDPRLEVGSRARLTAPSLGLVNFVGTVRSIDEDGLRIDGTTIPFTALTRLEIGRVRSREALVGAVVGGALGLAVARAVAGPGWGPGAKLAAVPGAVTGAAVGASPRQASLYGGVASLGGASLGAALCTAQCRRGDSDVSFAQYLAMYVGVPAAVGLTLGAVSGALIHFREWREVPVADLRVGPLLSEHGNAIGVVLVFVLPARSHLQREAL